MPNYEGRREREGCEGEPVVRVGEEGGEEGEQGDKGVKRGAASIEGVGKALWNVNWVVLLFVNAAAGILARGVRSLSPPQEDEI